MFNQMDLIADRYEDQLQVLEEDAKDLFAEAEDAQYDLRKFIERLQNDYTTIPTQENGRADRDIFRTSDRKISRELG